MHIWTRKSNPASKPGKRQWQTYPLCLLSIGLLGLLTLPGFAGDSPFTSQEEKTFLLKLAGRDGLIDQAEWNESNRDEERAFFKEVSWNSLNSYDFDHDGRISLNEFFDHLVAVRQKNSSSRSGSAVPSEGPVPGVTLRSGLRGAVPGDPLRNDSLETNSLRLGRRAQIAKNIKLQNQGDSLEDSRVQEDLMTRRKILQARRRYASAMDSTKPAASQNNIRDLFKSRIVKDRLSRMPDAEPATRSSLSHPRLSAPPEGTRGRPRDDAEAMEKTRASTDRRAQVPSRDLQNNNRPRPDARDAADIRDLIPPSQESSRSEKLKEYKSSGK
ncbi:MAG: hypothetical protein KJ645_07220 [Planctomycetes bacterium]|nr:hypothetical protein [Planctomycetota bacterium]